MILLKEILLREFKDLEEELLYGTVIFSGQNNITIGSSSDDASQLIRLSVPSQSTQPAIGSLNDSSGTMSISGDGTYI